MHRTKSRSERSQVSALVLLPVVLALAITAAGVLGFVFWSTSDIDRRAVERQFAMIEAVMEARQQRIEHDLASVAARADTLSNTRIGADLNWIDNNVGQWMHEFFQHDRVVVLNPAGQPIYLMEDGDVVDAAQYRSMSGPIQQLLHRMQSMRPVALPGTEGPVRLSTADFAVIDGRPAVVGAMTVSITASAVTQQIGTQPTIVAMQFLDQQAAQQLSRQYMFENGQFTQTQSQSPDRATFAITASTGRFVAFFEWEPDRPGLMLLRQTGPVLGVAYVLAAILVFLLARRLRQSSVALEAGRRHAEHQAAHDQLTGLPNRMSFDTQLATVLADSRQNGTRLSLMMLDLDRFKQVNDTLGHQAGDELIRTVGKRIRAIVGDEAMIARLGGDEFAILMARGQRPAEVTAVATRIIEDIGRPFDLQPIKAHVGASIGIVNATANSEPAELIRKADIALYEAKAGGRNRAVVFEERMSELLQLHHTIEAQLREALIDGDQLSVIFQPLVDQATRRVIGAEALARWNHPKYGQISPARFIPVAENTGLIEALGEFVLWRSCELGATVPGRTIAVNISPTQLRNPRFSVQVFDILHQTGMRPTDLELEITESILLDDEHISALNLRTFRAAGIHIALDDFGTGYSSLSYLQRYPVDRIKIDRSFVMQLADGHVSVALTQAIVTLAHAMNLTVTAEGVETGDQARILGQLGCNVLQGYLFSGGVSAHEIKTIFADEANAPRALPTNAA